MSRWTTERRGWTDRACRAVRGPLDRLPALYRAHRSGPTADFDVGIAGLPTTTSDGTTQDGRPGCEYGPMSGPARGSARSRSARWIHPRGDRELGVPTPARPGLRLITAGSAVPTEGRRLQLRGVPAVQPGRRFSDEMASAGPGTNRPFPHESPGGYGSPSTAVIGSPPTKNPGLPPLGGQGRCPPPFASASSRRGASSL